MPSCMRSNCHSEMPPNITTMSSSTMATPCRSAMRLLSARSRCMLQNPRVTSTLSQTRYSSRYSNPAARATGSTLSARAPSFLDQQQNIDSEDAEDRAVNPLDELAARREFEAKRANAMHRMRFAAVGLLMSVGGLTLTLYNLDLDELEKSANKKKAQLDAGPGSEDFQGRHVHIIGAGEDKRIVAEGDQELDLVKTGSGSVPYFPRKIYLPVPGTESSKSETAQPNSRINPGNVQNQEEYTMVGLGIRTVSFLSIEVYVMGLYVRTQDISTLQARLIHLINPDASTLVPGEKDGLKQRSGNNFCVRRASVPHGVLSPPRTPTLLICATVGSTESSVPRRRSTESSRPTPRLSLPIMRMNLSVTPCVTSRACSAAVAPPRALLSSC